MFDKSAIIIQARMGSIRFPGKMMACIFNMPLVEYVYRRCRKSSVSKVIVATSGDKSDDVLFNHCKVNDISIIRGNLDNVLERYIQTGEYLNADYIVRVCGDTPFVDIFLMDTLLGVITREKLDYVSIDRDKCAACFYFEIVAMQTLKDIAELTHMKEDLEHVTKFIVDRKNKFQTKLIDVDLNPEFIKGIRLTIDYPQDLQIANLIVAELEDKFSFRSEDVLNIVNRRIDLMKEYQ